MLQFSEVMCKPNTLYVIVLIHFLCLSFTVSSVPLLFCIWMGPFFEILRKLNKYYIAKCDKKSSKEKMQWTLSMTETCTKHETAVAYILAKVVVTFYLRLRNEFEIFPTKTQSQDSD